MDPRMSRDIITDVERYPTATDQGRRMLQFLREHPHAPLYRNESGNRLTVGELKRVRAFEREALSSEPMWEEGAQPDWIEEFTTRCQEDVPFYRSYGSSRFTALPTISRADLSRDIAPFVPDSIDVERLINFRTSGTTGHGLLLASHPVVAASYLAFHKKALRRFGIELRHGRGQVGVVLAGLQRKCFTYVSITPTMDESGLAKINLHPDDWRHPDDRARYLDALAPEIYTGDPISFDELAKLPLQNKPRAMLSTSMTLLPAMRARLEAHFGCPVLDIYSMNEAGPLAVFDERADGHVLLQHRMFVEILGADGQRLPPGQRGEITLTGGFNFCLPLLRYRTGDFASLERVRGEWVLLGLEGRPPVRFRRASGEWLNNIEITHALQRFALPQFRLHQGADGSLHLQISGGARQDEPEVRRALENLLGPAPALAIEHPPAFDGKVIQYTSALAQPS